MKSMGVILFRNGINNEEMNFLKTKKIKLIPINTRDVNNKTHLWLHYYCDAKWSQWPAAGTDDHEDAGLERDLEKTFIPPGENYVKTVPFASADTIIWGPYYTQENIYVVQLTARDSFPVVYTAEFELMLQKNNQYPHTATTVYEMTDPICSLQVTTTKIIKINNSFINNSFIKDSVWVIKDTILTRGSFSSLNEFKKFMLGYNLGNVPREFTKTKNRNLTEGPEWSG